jgi:hypothetical protein
MLSTYNNDLSVYVALAVCIFFLYRGKRSLKGKMFSGSTYTHRMLSYFMGVLLFSGLLYWHYRRNFSVQPGIESWLIAFDVTLAHMMVTLTLVLVVYFLLQPMVEAILKGLSFLLAPVMFKLEDRSCLQIVFLILFENIPPIGTWLIISIISIKIFLLDTLDLQEILFGTYEPSLGFSLPTAYRFSILSTTIKMIYNNFAANEIFAALLAFFIVASASVMGITGIIKTMGDLEKTIFARRIERRMYTVSPAKSSDNGDDVKIMNT